MVPTMSEYFNSWKNSRFIMGDASEQRDFVVISRLSDIQNILGSLQVVYGEVKPLVEVEDPAQAAQIETSLDDLKQFVADVYAKEQGGYQHTPEEADVLGAEAQNRATAIAGQVAQIAAKLNIKIEE
jgi:iron uptake system EfeUOB component EfeO/EfeM